MRWGLLVVLAGAAMAAEPEAARSRLGMNLSGPADWATELPFVDVFRLSRRWISQRQGGAWGTGPALELDEHGWVKRLEPGCWADTPLCTIASGRFPQGRYVCLYQGQGKIELRNIGRVVDERPGRIEFETKPGTGPIWLRLAATDPADIVRDIHVIMPGFEETWRQDPFHPAFLARWKSFNTFRFMDWMKTNGSPVATWADRPKPDDATWTERGIPLEVMIELCNRLRINPWFCLPHQADDDYVRRFAQMARERLQPDLKVYLEYSNEVWNNLFAQTRYAQGKGKEQGLGAAERPWEGGGMYYTRRSLQLFAIFEQVFGGRERLVRVLSWQSGSVWWFENILLPTDGAAGKVDALAIAPYFGILAGPRSTPTAEVMAGWTVDQVLDQAETVALPAAIKNMQAVKQLADQHQLALLAYEGGQHLVGVGGGENNQRLTDLFRAANRHPRMGALYTRYLDAWRDAGGGLFCVFSSCSAWSKWGSWGLIEFHDETEADQPKFKAVMDWNRANAR